VFHRRSPAAAKLLSPKLMRIRGKPVFSEKMNGDEDDHDPGLLRVNLELHKAVGGGRGAAGAEVARGLRRRRR